MKAWIGRGLLIVWGVLLFFLLGCNGLTPSSPPEAGEYTASVSGTFGIMPFSGTVTKQANNRITLSFVTPVTLYGVTVGCEGENLSMEIGGVSVTVDGEKVPNGALVKLLSRSLTVSAENGNVTDEGYTVIQTEDGMTCTTVLDKKTGLPLSVTVPEQNLSATFTY